MRTANAMDANDLSVYLTLLSDQSNFIEAQTALEQVQARNGQVQTMATSLNTKPRPSEGDLLSAVKGAQTGAAVLRIGDRLYGLGSYAKAAEVYAQAKARGVDANLVAERQGGRDQRVQVRHRRSRGCRADVAALSPERCVTCFRGEFWKGAGLSRRPFHMGCQGC